MSAPRRGAAPRRRAVEASDFGYGGAPATLLLWSLYVMLAMLGTLAAISVEAQAEPEYVRVAAQKFLTFVAVGVCVFWPAMRLACRRRGTAIRVASGDALGILIPTQALWLLTSRCQWEWGVTAAVLGTLCVWIALCGAVVAHGLLAGRRAWWVAACVCCCGGAPAAVLLIERGGEQPPAWWPAVSPATAVYGIADAAGAGARNTPGWCWPAASAVGGAAAVLWAGALWRAHKMQVAADAAGA